MPIFIFSPEATGSEAASLEAGASEEASSAAEDVPAVEAVVLELLELPSPQAAKQVHSMTRANTSAIIFFMIVSS